MERREKLLAGGLGLAALLWGGSSFYDSNVSQPLLNKEAELAQVEKDVEVSQAAMKNLKQSQKLLRESVSDSLPPNKDDAQRLYGNWVQELAVLSHWRDVDSKNVGAPGQLGKIGAKVPITLTGKAHLGDVATFLWHFEHANLLHRVASLELKSPSYAEGDPELLVTIDVEGVSLAAALQRKRLFPETELTAALDEKATQMAIAGSEGFPAKAPFRIRMGKEFATVTAISGKNWTLARAVDGTDPVAHAGKSSVEYAPFRPTEAGRETGIASYQHLLEHSGFAKPSPTVEFKPKLTAAVIPTLTRGEAWPAELKVEGWNPKWPAAAFELVTPPTGLSISPVGKLAWEVPAETKAGEFKVKLLAKAGDVAKVDAEINVTLQEKNRPPKFDSVALIQAYVGRAMTLPVVAKDEDTGNKLTFALAGTIPVGLTIDANTGTLSWTPAETVPAGPLAFQVTATDNGTPPLVATQQISGKLDDDHAQHTRLTSSIEEGETRVAWLTDLLDSRTMTLHVGDTVKTSELEFVVDSIDGEGIIIRMKGGVRQRLELAQFLRQAKPLPADPKTPPAPPAAVRLPLEK